MTAEEELAPECDELLRCAALRPRLGSLLFYDVVNDAFQGLVEDYSRLLSALGATPTQTRLGPTASDESLWGTGLGLKPPWYVPGKLVTAEPDTLRLVVIPDLSALSLAASRALVALMGAEQGQLERSGQQLRFTPRLRWIAACPSDRVGRLSPHLLDRFALRSTAARPLPPTTLEQRVARLARELGRDRGPTRAPPLEAAEAKLLQGARAHQPTLSAAILGELSLLCAPLKRPGMRTELTLAETALALAQLKTSRAVTSEHVARAAELLELVDKPAPPPPALTDSTASKPPEGSSSGNGDAPSDDEAPPAERHTTPDGSASDDSADKPTILTPEPLPPPEPTPLAAVEVKSALVLERDARIEREVAPLKVPLTHHRSKRKGRGEVVGVEPTRALEDLAITATLLAAAPYQTRRRAQKPDSGRKLLLEADDLRSYRRAPAAESLLVLLLDYTCLRQHDWGSAALPYLRNAYTERAQIAVVQVGGAQALNELRAELVLARSILVGAVAATFVTAAGRATPLAHGLATALEVIQRSTNHGRSAVRHVTFVAATDGRGNVPLLASRNGELTGPVGRQGIADAMAQADLIGNEPRVSCVLLSPQTSVLKDLPLSLAARLRADLIELRPLPDARRA